MSVSASEDYVLKVAFSQTLLAGNFTPLMTTFGDGTLTGQEIKALLRNLEKLEMIAHHGVTMKGATYAMQAHLLDSACLAVLEHYKRGIIETIVSLEDGDLVRRGLPISKLVELSPVSYSLLIVVIAVLELDGFLSIDRRRVVTPGPNLANLMTKSQEK